MPPSDLAEVRITAASPEVARQVAQALRCWFASSEQRSYPAGEAGSGTRLQLTVDTAHTPQASPFFRQRPGDGNTPGDPASSMFAEEKS
jgi:hypothetical protein